MSNPTRDFVVLPPAARVNWERVNMVPWVRFASSGHKNVLKCADWVIGPHRGITTCSRVAGHTGRHAAISQDGTVRKVWE